MATVASTPRFTASTLGSDTAGPFNVGFRLFESDALTVYVNGEKREDWTLTADLDSGHDDAATITFADDLSSGDILWIEGSMIPERETDYGPTEPRQTDKLNAELARVWATLVETVGKAANSLRTTTAQPPVNFDDGAVPMFKDGVFQNGPTADEITAAQGYATAASASASAAEAAQTAAEAAADTIDVDKLAGIEAGATRNLAVDTFSDLANLTASDLDEGDYAQVTETGMVVKRVPSGGDLDYSGSGGVQFDIVLPVSRVFADEAELLADTNQDYADGQLVVVGDHVRTVAPSSETGDWPETAGGVKFYTGAASGDFVNYSPAGLLQFDIGVQDRIVTPDIGSRFGQLDVRLSADGSVDEDHIISQIAGDHFPANYDTFDPTSLSTGDYLVDPAGDGTDGLTWSTAFQTIDDALAQADTKRIGVKGGIYRTAEGLHNSKLNSWTSSNDLCIYGIDASGDPSPVYFAKAKSPTTNWISTAVPDIWRITLTADGYSSADWEADYALFGLVDFEVLDDEGNPYVYELSAAQDSQSTGDLEEGQYFISSTSSIYMKRKNGVTTTPTRSSVLLFQAGYVDVGRESKKIYMQDVWVVGGVRADGGNDDSRVCMMRGGLIGRRDRDNAQVLDVGGFVAIGTQNYTSAKDGFNYTPYDSTTPHALEVNVVSYNHKFNTDIKDVESGTANASTAHSGCNVLRIGGRYYDCSGPILADVSASTVTYSWRPTVYAPRSDKPLIQVQDGEGYVVEPKLGPTDATQVKFDGDAKGHLRGRVNSMTVEKTASVDVLTS